MRPGRNPIPSRSRALAKLAVAVAALAGGASLLWFPPPRPALALAPAHARGGEVCGTDGFAALMHEAMARMDAGMSVPPSGDPDRDFARMMIPHHQGAVDMALAELRFGRDERLRRLAQGIVVEQRQEIELMQSILRGGGAGPEPAGPAPR